MSIYVNGVKSNLSNIFDYTENHESLGRTTKEILSDWENYHATFYYVGGNKVYFTLI